MDNDELTYEIIDLHDIDIDTYDWANDKYIAIINGKLMDIRTCGKAVQGRCYGFGRNVDKHFGKVFRCKICKHIYSYGGWQTNMNIHVNSKKHRAALAGMTKKHKYVN